MELREPFRRPNSGSAPVQLSALYSSPSTRVGVLIEPCRHCCAGESSQLGDLRSLGLLNRFALWLQAFLTRRRIGGLDYTRSNGRWFGTRHRPRCRRHGPIRILSIRMPIGTGGTWGHGAHKRTFGRFRPARGQGHRNRGPLSQHGGGSSGIPVNGWSEMIAATWEWPQPSPSVTLSRIRSTLSSDRYAPMWRWMPRPSMQRPA